jgi:uncharacterized protein YecE (DUF72 family)
MRALVASARPDTLKARTPDYGCAALETFAKIGAGGRRCRKIVCECFCSFRLPDLLVKLRASYPIAMGVKASAIRIGTAGWTLPRQHAHAFPAEGTHLQRCAAALNCVEVNSSFHRPHMRKTWERWAACTPAEFRFSVKLPKAITHTAQLNNCGELLQKFLDETRGLGAKLGPLLVQLPPRLAFDEGLAHEFFTTLRELYPAGAEPNQDGLIALEPRHASWFTPGVSRLLRGFEVARVAADPPKGSPLAAEPAGWPSLRYYRLHGAPRTYYSEYSKTFLKKLAATLHKDAHRNTWVIFDNTALGHATANALTLAFLLKP